MDFSVFVAPRAERQIKSLPKLDGIRVARKLQNLASDPRPIGSEKLSQAPCFRRIKVGNYRIIYQVDDGQSVVAIVLVRHRKDAYRDLDKLDPNDIQEIIQTRLASLR